MGLAGLRRKRQVLATTSLALALTLGVAACAAKTPRDRGRVSALAVGEAVLTLDQAERQLYEGSVYDKATHDKLGAVVLRVLYASRAFERAMAGWSEGVPMPQAVGTAEAALRAALADVEKAVPQAAAARDPLLRALAAIRALLTPPQAQLLPDRPVLVAQLPAGGLMGLFALFNLLSSLLASGRTTYDRLRALLKAEGATAEELAELDARLSDAIARREAEQTPPTE